MATPYDTDLDRNPANFQPLTPLSFLARAAAVYPDAHRDHSRHAVAGTIGDFLRAREELGSALARRGIRRGDTVAAMLANTPAMLEAHYGVPMAGAVLNTINTRLDAAIIALHARSRRGQGADRRSRIFQGGERRAGALQGEAARHRLRRSGIHRRRRAARQHRIRRFSARGRCRFRLADAGRRMGRDLAQLYVGHHRRSQGRRLPSPRRLSARDGQRHHLRHGQASGLSVDLADVSLQRLVLPVDAVDRRRHACLPARGARRADLRRHRHPQGDASVRRADRDVDAAQCAGAREEAAAARRRIRHRGGAAAGSGAGGDEGRGLQRHPRLRTDRDLRTGERQRLAPRMGRHCRLPNRRRRKRARACAIRCSKRSTCSIPKRCSRCRATARRSAK